MSEHLIDTPLDEIPGVRGTLYHAFRTGRLRPLAYRRAQLAQLALLIQENHEACRQALAADLGKPAQEANSGELSILVDRALYAMRNIEVWAAPVKPEVPSMFASLDATILKQPRGVVLILGPYNYPLLLCLQPLIGAMAAGCAALVKPSDLAHHTAALLARLFPKYLDQDLYRIVHGGVPQATKLLELKWDHVFYTGGKHVGRIVAMAAAKHLTPVTLELGGKSPVIVDGAYDIHLAARRILFGKIQNTGQVCVTPDYVIVPRSKEKELIAAFAEVLKEFFPDGSFRSHDFGRIISDRHFERISDMLRRTDGQVVLGGQSDPSTREMELTVITNVKESDSLLEDEIFGPLLPIITLDTVEEAIQFVIDRPSPLALYVFTSDEKFRQKVVDETASGCIVLNDTFWQVALTELPLGGVGDSGYGAQVGKYTFDGFTHDRAYLNNPKEAEPYLAARYPPYTPEKDKVFSAGLFQDIPRGEGVSKNA